jgi:hypothetical protein
MSCIPAGCLLIIGKTSLCDSGRGSPLLYHRRDMRHNRHQMRWMRAATHDESAPPCIQSHITALDRLTMERKSADVTLSEQSTNHDVGSF